MYNNMEVNVNRCKKYLLFKECIVYRIVGWLCCWFIQVWCKVLISFFTFYKKKMNQEKLELNNKKLYETNRIKFDVNNFLFFKINYNTWFFYFLYFIVACLAIIIIIIFYIKKEPVVNYIGILILVRVRPSDCW